MRILADFDPDAARQGFDDLSRDQVEAAIRRMASEGFGDYTIAAATRQSVETVRQILAAGPCD